MLRKIGLIAAIILCVVLLKAQTITVLDRFTNNPVAQATIQELETNRGAITNAQGKADLLSFNENSTLLIRHPPTDLEKSILRIFKILTLTFI